jgi:hypothetical protein
LDELPDEKPPLGLKNTAELALMAYLIALRYKVILAPYWDAYSSVSMTLRPL